MIGQHLKYLISHCFQEKKFYVSIELKNNKKPSGQEGSLFKLFPLARKLRHVALGLWLSGVPWKDASEKAHQALVQVGLQDIAKQAAPTLSGGQQQRAAIARTLVQGVKLVLADEPIASLDPESSRKVMEIFIEKEWSEPYGQ